MRDIRSLDIKQDPMKASRDIELVMRDFSAAIRRLGKGEKPNGSGTTNKLKVAQQAPSDSGIAGPPSTTLYKSVATYTLNNIVGFYNVPWTAGWYRLSAYIWPAAVSLPTDTCSITESFDDTGYSNTGAMLLVTKPLVQDVNQSASAIFYHAGSFGLGVSINVSVGSTCRVWLVLESL